MGTSLIKELIGSLLSRVVRTRIQKHKTGNVIQGVFDCHLRLTSIHRLKLFLETVSIVLGKVHINVLDIENSTLKMFLKYVFFFFFIQLFFFFFIFSSHYLVLIQIKRSNLLPLFVILLRNLSRVKNLLNINSIKKCLMNTP